MQDPRPMRIFCLRLWPSAQSVMDIRLTVTLQGGISKGFVYENAFKLHASVVIDLSAKCMWHVACCNALAAILCTNLHVASLAGYTLT